MVIIGYYWFCFRELCLNFKFYFVSLGIEGVMDPKSMTDSGYEGAATPGDAVPTREYVSSVCDRLRAALSTAEAYMSPSNRMDRDSGSLFDGRPDSGYEAAGSGQRAGPATGTLVWGLDPPPVPVSGRGTTRPHSYAKPPKFDGKGMGWDEFILQFSTVASLNGWVEPELGQQLFVNLEGDARSFVVGLRLPRMDYQVLVRKLEGWFGSATRKESFRNQLQSRRRSHGESVTSYAAEVGRLVSKAYPGYPEEVLRELTLKSILDGLPEGDLKHEVCMHCPQDIESAVRLIERWENLQRMGVQKVKPQIRAVGEVDNQTRPEAKMLEEILKLLKQLSPAKPKAFQGKRPGRCFECGDEGHYRYECPRLKNQGN